MVSLLLLWFRIPSFSYGLSWSILFPPGFLATNHENSHHASSYSINHPHAKAISLFFKHNWNLEQTA